jgi:hypothetical protein
MFSMDSMSLLGVYMRLASACNTCHFSPGEFYARLASLWNPASIPRVRFEAGYTLHPILHSYTYQVKRTSIKSKIFLENNRLYFSHAPSLQVRSI